ncbi:MAG: glycine zipper family protein [Polyangiaceae bacterium]
MAEVFALALSFPSVVFTVLLGVVLVYWAFVMVGVIHIGEGSEGALDGLGDGGVEGATKGLLEGHLDGGDIGGDHADLGDGGELESAGAVASLLHALHLRSAPATVVLSLLVTFSWLVSVLFMQAVTRLWPALQGTGLSALVLLLSPIGALPFTSLAVRPLSGLFAPRRAPTKADLIGKTCVVRTGSVSERFGEATLEDGGAGLVIRVRVDGGKQLKRGEQALIVDFDREHETFLVEPMRDVER